MDHTPRKEEMYALWLHEPKAPQRVVSMSKYPKVIRREIEDRIRSHQMRYGDGLCSTTIVQIQNLRKDWLEMSLATLNGRLKGGHVTII